MWLQSIRSTAAIPSVIDRLQGRFGGTRVVAPLLALGLVSLGLLAYFSVTIGSEAVQRQAAARVSAASTISATYAQGFYFSRAIPGTDFTNWVKEHPGAGCGESGSKKVA
jgi:hypothetical protein